MPGLKDECANVYLELGRILDQPQLFGLGELVPEALAVAVIRMRRALLDEMTKEPAWLGDYLEDELSQDADRPVIGSRKKTA